MRAIACALLALVFMYYARSIVSSRPTVVGLTALMSFVSAAASIVLVILGL